MQSFPFGIFQSHSQKQKDKATKKYNIVNMYYNSTIIIYNNNTNNNDNNNSL